MEKLRNCKELNVQGNKTARKSVFTVLFIIMLATTSFSFAGCSNDPIVGTYEGQAFSNDVILEVNSNGTFNYTILNTAETLSGTWEREGDLYSFTIGGDSLYAVVGTNGMTVSDGSDALYPLTRTK